MAVCILSQTKNQKREKKEISKTKAWSFELVNKIKLHLRTPGLASVGIQSRLLKSTLSVSSMAPELPLEQPSRHVLYSWKYIKTTQPIIQVLGLPGFIDSTASPSLSSVQTKFSRKGVPQPLKMHAWSRLFSLSRTCTA